MLTEIIVETARKQQTDKLRDAIALAVRTARSSSTVQLTENALYGVDTLVFLIETCCKDADDTFDRDQFNRLCRVKQ